MVDRSSRPHRLRAALDAGQRDTALTLRGDRLTIRAITTQQGVPVSTMRRWLASQGMNRLPRLKPPPPVVRYKHAAPGDLLHLDIKKLGRIVRPSHRVTGDRRHSVDGAGWGCVHLAIDDHRRSPFFAQPSPITRAWASPSRACSPTTDRRIARKPSRPYATNWASSIASRVPIPRAPTAKPSALSRPPYANGHMSPPTPTAPTGKRLCNRGCTDTITTDLIPPSATDHPSAGFRGTTCRTSTTSHPSKKCNNQPALLSLAVEAGLGALRRVRVDGRAVRTAQYSSTPLVA